MGPAPSSAASWSHIHSRSSSARIRPVVLSAWASRTRIVAEAMSWHAAATDSPSSPALARR